MKKTRKITPVTRFAYGTGNLLGSGALAISGSWLLFFYTTFCHLPIAQATLIFSIATYLDVIMNPLMGFISDSFYKTKLGRRFGRRRFFILIGIPLMCLYPLLWVKGMNFWYYFSTYIMFEIVYTGVMIPYNTLPVEMTNTFEERTYLAGSKAMFGKIANFLGAALPGLFIGIYGQDSPTPFFCTGLCYGAILVVSMILLYFNTWERPCEEVEDESVANIAEGFKKLFTDILSTLKVRTFRHHLGMYLFGFGAEWLFTATFTYYVVYVLAQPSTFVSEMNSISSILQLISTMLFVGIVAKKGFKKPFIWALSVVIAAILGYIAVAFVHVPNLTIVMIAIVVVFGLGTGGVYYIPWTSYTFMADVDEVVTNRRREGIYAGAMTMAGKLLRASIVSILGFTLAAFGFKEGVSVQPQSAQNAIIGVMLIGCCGLALLGIVFSFKMKLTQDTHKIVIAELERVHGGGKMEDVDPEVKKVLEQLTGVPYENCFGNNNIGYKPKKAKLDNSVSVG